MQHQMNRHIKHYFHPFSGMAHLECETCKALKDYIEIDNEAYGEPSEPIMVFPPEVEQLEPLNPDLVYPYLYDGELWKCPKCNTHYFRREWSPGGSDDFMRTYIYECVKRIGCFGVYMELADLIATAKTIRSRAKRKKEVEVHRIEVLEKMIEVAESEQRKLHLRAEEMIMDALACFAERPSVTTNKWYRDDVIAAEVFAARLIAKFLDFVPDGDRRTDIPKKVAKLLDYKNKELRKRIAAALKRIGYQP